MASWSLFFSPLAALALLTAPANAQADAAQDDLGIDARGCYSDRANLPKPNQDCGREGAFYHILGTNIALTTGHGQDGSDEFSTIKAWADPEVRRDFIVYRKTAPSNPAEWKAELDQIQNQDGYLRFLEDKRPEDPASSPLDWQSVEDLRTVLGTHDAMLDKGVGWFGSATQMSVFLSLPRQDRSVYTQLVARYLQDSDLNSFPTPQCYKMIRDKGFQFSDGNGHVFTAPQGPEGAQLPICGTDLYVQK